MKVFGILLLVVNVVLVYWQYSAHVEDVTRAAMTHAPLPDDAATLMMLAEMDELPPLKTPAPDPDPAPTLFSEVYEHVKPADRCLDIGPFGDEVLRDRFRDWLRDYIAVLKTRVETVRTRQFFWVYLEPTTEATANQHIDDLKNRGFTDYMLIRRGNLKNAISLGLFRSQDSVNRRLAELSEKGYKPVVVPHFETTDQYWLTAQLAAAHSDTLELPESLLEEAKASEISCEAI